MDIKRIISRLVEQTAAERKILRENAERRLRQEPNDRNARELIQKLDEFAETLPLRSRAGRQVINWQSHGHGVVSCGWVDDAVVARIIKVENHTGSNQSIYQVEVHGSPLRGTFRYIKDARSAAERAHVAGVVLER